MFNSVLWLGFIGLLVYKVGFHAPVSWWVVFLPVIASVTYAFLFLILAVFAIAANKS